jgi:hypothetical protein
VDRKPALFFANLRQHAISPKIRQGRQSSNFSTEVSAAAPDADV